MICIVYDFLDAGYLSVVANVLFVAVVAAATVDDDVSVVVGDVADILNYTVCARRDSNPSTADCSGWLYKHQHPRGFCLVSK